MSVPKAVQHREVTHFLFTKSLHVAGKLENGLILLEKQYPISGSQRDPNKDYDRVH